MNRRSFLQTSALAAVAASFGVNAS
ncbi:MAG: twin-arginine translocation signal domain-containing protein, partial [Thermoguttaceae bacterium]|nr:twin-arginine translocation signal domain-containing protein [Thermoguttaceae bacterium]